MKFKTTVTGFPRIGENRELKKALEQFWAGKISLQSLQQISSDLRKRHWLLQLEKGIDLISCNDFSWYDQMLDTAVMVNAIPPRFQSIEDGTTRYFAMARGSGTAVAMGMTKWFNTNYHYIVPELDGSTRFDLNADKIVSEYREAQSLGIRPKINVIGPLTFLGLSKTSQGENPYAYFDELFSVYQALIGRLAELDKTVYVQFEEPIFVKDPTAEQLYLLRLTYNQLARISEQVRIIVTTYFEHASEAAEVLADTPIWGIGLDFVHGPGNMAILDRLKGKKLIAGVVDGRNIWFNDLAKTVNLLGTISRKVSREQIIVSSSCSLQHVPFSLDREPDGPIRQWLSFASEKLDEIVALGRIFHAPTSGTGYRSLQDSNSRLLKEKASSTLVTRQDVRQRVKNICQTERDSSYHERNIFHRKILNLPLLTTTTIGSFPQTAELRNLRRDYRNKTISKEQYEQEIKNYIDACVAFQEEIGLDVLVHGEPERTDMVEYFAEMLDGFHFTQNGWVQSYGSRCVKPPIIYGDVSRPQPMTVHWISYAQSKTAKPMKAMLTGPVTILNWSFVRDDLPRSEVSRQIAVALSDEIEDLQREGIRIIQVDEAAFKEGYPLRRAAVPAYEKWAVKNFRLAVSKALKITQVHTHMCYSDFNDIIKTIEKMDADVITIETARSGNELLQVFARTGYSNEIGPGVYDIHSPRIPEVDEFIRQILSCLEVVPPDRLWINPDCGLKTRRWEEVKPALANMVEAAKAIRSLAKGKCPVLTTKDATVNVGAEAEAD